MTDPTKIAWEAMWLRIATRSDDSLACLRRAANRPGADAFLTDLLTKAEAAHLGTTLTKEN